jgi:DUF4097 and DUF4098 domain-containing protein YvlB
MKLLKINSHILLFTVILLCIPSFLFASAEEKIEEVYPLDRDGKVYLENVSGDIVVKSWKKNEIKILARKVAKNEESLDRVTVKINQTNGNIRINTKYKNTWGLSKSVNASVHYDLLVPDRAQIRVKSVSGDIEAYIIGGPVDLETVSGKIELAGAGMGAECKSVSGSVYAEEITGDTKLNSTSGKVNAKDIKGSVEANSVSGSVVLEKISDAEEIEAESISGSIKMQGELSSGGNYEFKTISGGVRLDLPSKSDFELEASTMSGSLSCDFDMKVSGKMLRKKMEGVVGKGGAILKISTLSGGIKINKN